MVCAANTLTPTSRNSYFATIAAFTGTSRSKRSSGSPRVAGQKPTATSLAPGQDDVGRHVPDNARIVPVIAREPRIGGVAVGDQRRAGPRVGAHESLDRFGRVV